MKSRLIKGDDMFQLLLCDNNIITCSEEDAVKYIKNYKEDEFFFVENLWDHEISMENFERIPGAILDRHAWKIPEDAPYPKDFRKGKRVIIEE